MDSAQDDQDGHAEEVMESVGEPKEKAHEINDSHESEGTETSDPLYVQKRLKQQKRAHDREIRDLHAKIESMQSRALPDHEPSNPYPSPGQPEGVDEQIHKAVSFALGAKEREERKAKEQESQAHVHRQYQDLHKHLDRVSDKYEDFDDVVRGQDTPFTPHMRDAALFLDMDHKNPGSAGEVLYKLGKNPEELERISRLHPLDQAREMVKLSKALISSGGEHKSHGTRPLGQIKNTPVSNSPAVNEKTSIGSLRQRMKEGNWK